MGLIPGPVESVPGLLITIQGNDPVSLDWILNLYMIQIWLLNFNGVTFNLAWVGCPGQLYQMWKDKGNDKIIWTLLD